MDALTFGLELEWADVDKRTPIPADLGAWDWKDYTIVNSDGHANDPTGKSWVYGGEINTAVTATPHEQADIVQALNDLLHPTVNHSCALHVHIGYPPLKDDIVLLQQFMAYTIREQAYFYATSFRQRKPSALMYPDDVELKAAKKHHAARAHRSTKRLPANRVTEVMNADNPQAFYDAHAPLSGNTGKRVWHLSARSGVNMKALWKHGTVEFRCFAGTTSAAEALAAVEWSRLFFTNALTDGQSMRDFPVPEQLPVAVAYDHALQRGFDATKFEGRVDGRSHIGD